MAPAYLSLLLHVLQLWWLFSFLESTGLSLTMGSLHMCNSLVHSSSFHFDLVYSHHSSGLHLTFSLQSIFCQSYFHPTPSWLCDSITVLSVMNIIYLACSCHIAGSKYLNTECTILWSIICNRRKCSRREVLGEETNNTRAERVAQPWSTYQEMPTPQNNST